MKMGIVSNIICKTAGIAGMGAVLYDAYTVGSEQSYRTSQKYTADRFEKIVSAQRTLTDESHVASAMQNKIADLRMSNPLIPFWGRVKGFFEGSLESLGNNIIPVACASLALLTKGFLSKAGAAGLGGCALYAILNEGFGIGKNTPIDEAQK